MMDPTGAAWATANPTASQAFFGLLWEQLCGGSTLDSWQLRALNVQAVLREVLQVCADAHAYHPLQRALPDIFAEALHASRRDPVLHDHFRVATSVLEDPKLKEQTTLALSHAEHTALHLLDTLRNYPGLLRSALERALADPAAHEKKRIVRLANALGTELLNRGFSRVYLQSFAERLVEEPFATVLGELLDLLGRPASKFRCIVPVSWPAFVDDLRLGQGSVHATLPELESTQEANQFRTTISPPDDRFFVTDVEAHDQYAAAQTAALLAGQVMNLAVFYLPNRRPEIPRRSTLVQSGTTAWLVEPDLSHESYIRDSRGAADKLLRASPRVMELLYAPLQYHALGVQASAPESRLTNFWVSLEALLVDHDGSIIEKVTKYIPPSLALSYVGRLLRANAIEIARYIQAAGRNLRSEAAALRELLDLPQRGKVSIPPAALAEMLLDDDRAKKLCAMCG